MFEYNKGKTPITKLTGFRKEWRHYWNKIALKNLLKKENNKLHNIIPAYDRTTTSYGVVEDMVSFLKYHHEAKPLFSTKEK